MTLWCLFIAGRKRLRECSIHAANRVALASSSQTANSQTTSSTLWAVCALVWNPIDFRCHPSLPPFSLHFILITPLPLSNWINWLRLQMRSKLQRPTPCTTLLQNPKAAITRIKTNQLFNWWNHVNSKDKPRWSKMTQSLWESTISNIERWIHQTSVDRPASVV